MHRNHPAFAIALFLAGALLLALPARAGTADSDFAAGLSAFNAGDYSAALGFWRPWADRSDPRSEQGIGFMYHRGLGLAVDDATAAYWFLRAAEHGQPEAQLMLGVLYFFGEGVPQSNVDAYAWCDLAQNNGQTDATLCRDAALQAMTSADEMKAAFALGQSVRDTYGRPP